MEQEWLRLVGDTRWLGPHMVSRAVMRPIHLWILALYKLFVCLLNLLSYFFPSSLSSFLILSFLLAYFFRHLLLDVYISTFSRIDPFRFQTGGGRRRPNLAVVFFFGGGFISCCSIFCYRCMFAFVICFSTKPRDCQIVWEERL